MPARERRRGRGGRAPMPLRLAYSPHSATRNFGRYVGPSVYLPKRENWGQMNERYSETSRRV